MTTHPVRLKLLYYNFSNLVTYFILDYVLWYEKGIDSNIDRVSLKMNTFAICSRMPIKKVS